MSGPIICIFDMVRQDAIVLTEEVHCQKYTKTGSLYVPFLNYNFGNVSL